MGIIISSQGIIFFASNQNSKAYKAYQQLLYLGGGIIMFMPKVIARGGTRWNIKHYTGNGAPSLLKM